MEALALLAELLSTATSAMIAATKVSELIKAAKAQGRDVTLDELKALDLADDNARAALEKALSDAGA